MFKVAIKLGMFIPFLGILYLAISFITSMVSPYIIGNNAIMFLSYIGLMDAASLYFSIIISGWGIKSILNYVSNM